MHHGQENGAGTHEHDDDPGDEEGLDEAVMHSDGGPEEGPPQPLSVRSQRSTQLTLSYQSEVYVFDTVPPEKVMTVLMKVKCKIFLVGCTDWQYNWKQRVA
jgi:hypothetical protein